MPGRTRSAGRAARFSVWRSSRSGRVEWPTVGVAVGVYGGAAAVTLGHRHLPWPLTFVLLGVLAAWQTSLQHEIIHGHPFRVRAANHALAWLPLTLWLPYGDYRDSHLRHHRVDELGDPEADPESFYVTPAHWAAAGPIRRCWLRANRTLVGRMVLGPVVTTPAYWWSALLACRHDARRRRSLASHLVGLVVVVAWIVAVCRMPLWLYVLGAFYGGRALSHVRSFAEHRSVDGGATRSAMVRAGRAWSLLFLNNNLHDTHHARPGAPWYRLPQLAVSLSSDARAAEGAGWYPGYTEVLRRYALRPFDRPVYAAADRTAV